MLWVCWVIMVHRSLGTDLFEASLISKAWGKPSSRSSQWGNLLSYCWTLWTHATTLLILIDCIRQEWYEQERSHVLDRWITFNWVFTKVEHSPLVCRRGRRCKCGWRRRGHVTCITQVLDYPHPTSPGAAWCEPPSAIAKKSAQAPIRLRLGDFFLQFRCLFNLIINGGSQRGWNWKNDQKVCR